MSIGLAVVAVVAIVLVWLYNGLVRRRNGVENAFASVDVQLQQRCDLVPRLVDSVRGSMAHEKGTFEQLTALRERASAPGASAESRMQLDAQMGGLMRGLVARMEAYPELKASANVDTLMRSLNETEAQIAAARRTYNAAVTTFNTAIETVPSNLVAGVFGFSRRPLFEVSADERAVPGVGSLAS